MQSKRNTILVVVALLSVSLAEIDDAYPNVGVLAFEESQVDDMGS
jgi:hypothetical protein